MRATGAVVRAQSPIVRGINDDAGIWANLWRSQVRLGVVPYYMFVPRDTGAHHLFSLPLARAYRVTVMGQRLFALRFLQARDPARVNRTFFARYDPDATWFDALELLEPLQA